MTHRASLSVAPLLAVAIGFFPGSKAVVAQDINGNAIRDALDLRAGTSQDCDRNGVPDEADLSRPAFSAAVEHSNDTATLTNVQASVPVDFDGDGDLDLVVSARSGTNNSTLSLWRNDGGPGFRFQSRFTISNALAFALRAGDLNGDGRQDIVASDFGLSNVIVALANPSGGLSTPVKIAVTSRAFGVALADLDGDGDLDIALPSLNGNGVDILRNNGNGTFAPKVLYPAGPQPIAVAVADVDGDGDQDLAIANSHNSAAGNGTVSILANDGSATFALLNTVTVPGNLPKPIDASLADLDSDGDADLIVASGGTQTINTFLNSGMNSGSGLFGSGQTLGPLPTIASSAGRFLCTNLDADAAPEIAWADPTAHVIHLYDNLQGTLTLVRSYAAGTEGPMSLMAADLVGDASVELVSANDSSSSFSILRGLGELRFDAVEHIRRSDSNVTPLLADFTGDEIVDLASYATSDSPATFRIAPGLGDGTFGPAAVISLPSAAPLFPRDLNGDGHLDLLGIGNSGNRYAKLNNGDGTFGAAVFSSPIQSNGNFQTADVNHDGFLDALWVTFSASSQPHKIHISLGDGNGGFAVDTFFEAPAFLGDIWTGDLTGDGAPEIIAGIAPGIVSPIGHETFLLYENDGSGGFAGYSVVASDLIANFSLTMGNFAVVDIDSDGDNDLLATANLTYLFRNNAGVLETPVSVGAIANFGRNALGPTIADADADGDLDFYGSATVSTLVSPTVFFNNGAGLFPQRSSVARYRNTTDATAVGDVDGDDRPDLLVRPQGFSDWFLHRIEASDVLDCNANGVADVCDITGGGSLDTDGDGVPDECQPPVVVGDLDGDGFVNGSDLAILLGSWGDRGGAADVNGDGTVDAADLGILLGAWGA